MTGFKNISLVLLLSAVAFTTTLQAATESQVGAVEKLGQLNGVALSCQNLAATRRMKQALIDTVPKERYLGELFDDVSNDSFLAFQQERKLCPIKSEYNAELDEALTELHRLFGAL
ncbi:MAG: hypothetical protein GY696_25380 [Gammaproteobacteria bacterium]|nr:hypothetical protein [Gammaproteobacteria bacterium]